MDSFPVHLRVHTEFSLLEGITRISDLERFSAIAITDSHNMFGASGFTKHCLEMKIHPILGCELKFLSGHSLYVHIQNSTGYSNLCRILSNCDKNGIKNFEEIRDYTDGLLALIGEKSDSRAIDTINSLFKGRVAVALSNYGEGYDTPGEFLEFAKHLEIPLIASNVSYFSKEEDYEAHDAMRCIASRQHIDDDKRVRLSKYHRLLKDEEWGVLFRDAPQSIENTELWAQRCSFVLQSHKQSAYTDDSKRVQLAKEAAAGLEIRTRGMLDNAPYRKQLSYELKVINQLGLEGYFLIVADYVAWAKEQKIPTSCRGSGAGSVVAWSMSITDIDPLRFSLVFERFLNPERVSMADFDIDFCQERRSEVIEYIKNKYGAESVAHICTFGTLQARAVLRDVGRILGIRYSETDALCKLIPFHPLFPVDLQRARETQQEIGKMIESDESIQRLWKLSEKLEGLHRHISTHAAGVVISDKRLCDYIPLYNDPDSDLKVTQFDMHAIERIGFIKFDILGLSGLTMTQRIVDLIKVTTGDRVDLESISFEDRKVFEYLGTGHSYGVFQLDSMGIRQILREMVPDKIEDLIALNALYRPGPVENIPTYISNRAHPENIEYLYPELEGILGETYGIIVYQEQVLQIAKVIAGFSLGEADLLRRAIGKKIEKEMKKQKSRFIKRATKLHGDSEKAEELFGLIEKFANYGFVKAHATCYAVLMYKMAFLKTHYTIHFITVGMTMDGQHHEKLIHWKMEADRENIRLLQPCVRKSKRGFSIEGSGIRYGLSAIKNVGEQLARKIENSGFGDIWEFARNIRPPKQAFENLIRSGAMDCFGIDRGVILENIELLLNHSQNTLFKPQLRESGKRCTLREELRANGVYLDNHPMNEFPYSSFGFNKCNDDLGTKSKIVGNIIHIERRRMKNGAIYGILYISDTSGIAEVSVFSNLWDYVQKALKIDDVVACTLRARRGLSAQDIRLVSKVGFDIDRVICAFDGDLDGVEVLDKLPEGMTKLFIQHRNQIWETGKAIKLTLDAIKAMQCIKDMRMSSHT